MHADGNADCFTAHGAIAEYLQRIVDGYHARGRRACRYVDRDAIPVGRNCAFGTVTWELLHEYGSVLSRWRESYNLVRVGDGMKVFVSVDHVE